MLTCPEHQLWFLDHEACKDMLGKMSSSQRVLPAFNPSVLGHWGRQRTKVHHISAAAV